MYCINLSFVHCFLNKYKHSKPLIAYLEAKIIQIMFDGIYWAIGQLSTFLRPICPLFRHL